MHKVNINGKNYNIDADKNMPLLWVLRDLLNMKGTKFGCGKGLCGACTVIIDGNATRSCITPVGTLSDSKVRTIEGLSRNADHPVQIAWKEHSVPQCGYCQPGQIMNATAFLENNKNPSDQDIAGAMSGNICRCGTYPRIKAAIKSAAKKIG